MSVWCMWECGFSCTVGSQKAIVKGGVHEKVGGVRGCAGGGHQSAGRGRLVLCVCMLCDCGEERRQRLESWGRH